MMKASKCRSYETHSYQMQIGFCQVVSKIRNLAWLVQIEQTARKLEANARANFLMAENIAYQCI